MTLTSAELTAMRAVQSAALPDSCTIQRPTYTTTDAGGSRPSGYKTIATVACAVSILSRESERVVLGAYSDGPQYLFVLPYGTSYLMTDVILYGSDRYSILGKLGGGAWDTALRLVAVRRDA